MDSLVGKSFLISGGTGFLGSHLVRRLFDLNCQNIFILVRQKSSLERISGVINKVKLINFENDSEIKQLKKIKFDYFIHASTCYGRRNESKEEIHQVNVNWPLEILSYIDHSKLILLNFGTSLPPDLNEYSASKHLFLVKVRNNYQCQIINLILEQFYGPGDGTFLSFVINQLSSKVPYLNLTAGTQQRDFIYYKDAVSAIIKILEWSLGSKNNRNEKYYDFSIGTGQSSTIRAIIEMIQKKLAVSETKLNWGGQYPIELTSQ